MRKKISLSILLLAGFSILNAQTNQLSNDQNRTQNPQEQPQQEIKLNATQQVVLKADGTWIPENSKFTIVVAPDNKKYALLANGKWSQMETVSDIEGNTYEAIKLGNYFWTTRNLETTKYNNGTPIKLSTNDNTVWNSPSGAYTNIEDKPENKSKMGLLYSWHTTNNPAKLCPKGWRIPSDSEWDDLFTFLGGKGVAGIQLKAESGWKNPEGIQDDPNGTNDYMFNAIATGYRQMHKENFSFWQLESEATFWSATSKSANDASTITLNRLKAVANRPSKKYLGRSVRCVK